MKSTYSYIVIAYKTWNQFILWKITKHIIWNQCRKITIKRITILRQCRFIKTNASKYEINANSSFTSHYMEICAKQCWSFIYTLPIYYHIRNSLNDLFLAGFSDLSTSLTPRNDLQLSSSHVNSIVSEMSFISHTTGLPLGILLTFKSSTLSLTTKISGSLCLHLATTPVDSKPTLPKGISI